MGQTDGVRIPISDWNPGPKLEKPSYNYKGFIFFPVPLDPLRIHNVAFKHCYTEWNSFYSGSSLN